jgi:hypothetical protein
MDGAVHLSKLFSILDFGIILAQNKNTSDFLLLLGEREKRKHKYIYVCVGREIR